MKELKFFMSAQFITSIALIVVMFLSVVILNHLSKRYRDRIDPSDVRMKAYIRQAFNAIKGLIVIIGIIVILQVNGIQVTSLVTGVGLISVIGGLALQDMFKDVIMGLHIINDHSIIVGEVVEINGMEGVVLSFSLTTTILKNLNTGNTEIICNRNITHVTKSVGIYDINLSIAYKEHPDRVREVLTRAAEEIDALDEITSAEYLAIQDYADSAVIYRIRFYCSPTVHWPMRRAAMGIVQKHIIESGLEIPYTRYDVQMLPSEA